MNPATYRVSALVRLVGIVGLAFVGYIVVYNLGFTTVALFARVGDFPLTEPGSWLYFLVVLSLSLTAIWLSAARVTVTDNEIVYQAPARRVVIRWDEISEATFWTGPQIRLRSGRRTISINGTFVGFKRLKAQIQERVKPESVNTRRIWVFGGKPPQSPQ
jgi:hypothetical protein